MKQPDLPDYLKAEVKRWDPKENFCPPADVLTDDVMKCYSFVFMKAKEKEVSAYNACRKTRSYLSACLADLGFQPFGSNQYSFEFSVTSFELSKG